MQNQSYAQTVKPSSPVSDYVILQQNNTNAGSRVTVEFESPHTLILGSRSTSMSMAGQVIDYAKQIGYSIDSATVYTVPYAINSTAVKIIYTIFMSK